MSTYPNIIAAKDARIAELEAEVERLARERDYWQSQHDERTRQLGQAEDEALSRTGAVKVSDMQLNAEERALANDMHALHRPEEQAVTEAMVDRFMKRMGWSDPIHEPVRPTVRAAIEAALEPAAPEGHPMPNPASIKAWRIKKSEPIPQWLEKTENVELTAGCDLIVIESEDGGFDVYRSDPNSFANMMEGTFTDPDKHATVTGAPTNFRSPTVLAAQIHELRAEIEELTRPSEQAVTEADLDDVEKLFLAARVEADKAMRKFPQPNYVISKIAEEAGEVVKAAIHCAEGRETSENVVAEIRQAMAMLIRLYIEGDQVHGLPPLKAAMEAGR